MGSKLRLEIQGVTARQLIYELADGNPAPQEKWFQRDDFDPTYSARELREAAAKGWLELETDDDPALWRFRLTPAGRAALTGSDALPLQDEEGK